MNNTETSRTETLNVENPETGSASFETETLTYLNEDFSTLADRLQDANEFIKSAIDAGFLMGQSALDDLIEILEALGEEDTEAYITGIKAFFGEKNADMIVDMDLSQWNMRHLARWDYMFIEASMQEEITLSSSARIFNLLVKEQLLENHPCYPGPSEPCTKFKGYSIIIDPNDLDE